MSKEFCASDRAAYEKLGIGDPFEIPKSWAWCRIGDVAEIITGATPRTSRRDFFDGDIPFIKPADLGINKNIGVTAETLTELGANQVRPIPTNAVCVCCIGSLGKVGIASSRSCTNQQINSIVSSYLLPDFMYYIASSGYFTGTLKSLASAITIALVNKSRMATIPIPLPPLAEQKRIAARIEELFMVAESLSEAADGLEATSRCLDKKILDLAIRGKLVPQNPTDEPASELVKRIAATSHKSTCKNRETPIEPPFEIPKSWEWAKLGTISNYGQCRSVDAQSISAETWSLDLEEIEKETGRLIVRKTAADKKSASSKHLFCKGMVLYSKLRTYLNKVLVADMDGVCTSEIVPIFVAAGITPEFLRIVLMSPYFLQYTASKGYGVKMPRVGTNDMRESLIPIPPSAEQQRIVDRVQELKHIVALRSAP